MAEGLPATSSSFHSPGAGQPLSGLEDSRSSPASAAAGLSAPNGSGEEPNLENTEARHTSASATPAHSPDPDPAEPEPAEPAQPEPYPTSAYTERLQWSVRMLLASKETEVSETEDEAETQANPQPNNPRPNSPHAPPPPSPPSHAPAPAAPPSNVPALPYLLGRDGFKYVLWVCRRHYPACDGPDMLLSPPDDLAQLHAQALNEQNFQTAVAVWVWTNNNPDSMWAYNRLLEGRHSGRPRGTWIAPSWVPLHGTWCVTDKSTSMCAQVPFTKYSGRTRHPPRDSLIPGSRLDGLFWPTPGMVNAAIAAWELRTYQAARASLMQRHHGLPATENLLKYLR